jgi:hypothetical protein
MSPVRAVAVTVPASSPAMVMPPPALMPTASLSASAVTLPVGAMDPMAMPASECRP